MQYLVSRELKHLIQLDSFFFFSFSSPLSLLLLLSQIYVVNRLAYCKTGSHVLQAFALSCADYVGTLQQFSLPFAVVILAQARILRESEVKQCSLVAHQLLGQNPTLLLSKVSCTIVCPLSHLYMVFFSHNCITCYNYNKLRTVPVA